ncbi:uncharacterized protein MYCGRDRAFT_31911 [Zymoseptoria tritici IPO323]|uniref:Chalcone synthase n=1 Tax=Zymoseptoria tritici (strain CBS 115943 / IPO323) TaxID=336722 RepID=F9X176_ZYMTI|nr:uncharacterized protein MYCGRDRAFT_31911 [Zymoseptoria tritici IPO323]EGP91445.1 hypothetical protein MYCGRDRAFT_31911 [Zymoseptoria tritici IPO323]
MQRAIDPKGGKATAPPDLWIAGLGSQYPPHVLEPKDLYDFATRFHNPETPGLKRLLAINKRTGIETRSAVSTYKDGFGTGKDPPTIADIDSFFRVVGVDLTVQASRKALQEWGGNKSQITHTVGVTCTSQGNPGYDVLVNQALGLEASIDRTLLHGVGCAGGLAIMRAAGQIAAGATAFGRPARILAFACELSTPHMRCELAAAERKPSDQVGIAGALFSDAAAAFVLTNRSCTVISRDVPSLIKQAVKPVLDGMLLGCRVPSTDNFDWALHPGGTAVVDGVKEAMGLTEHQLRATREIYRTKGNSSSPTVLIVLDRLRSMDSSRGNIVAASFGPGLAIEMALLERC